jgi:flagellar biogenesis protein FliO
MLSDTQRKSKVIMEKKKVLMVVGFLALIGAGYLVYRKIRTSSDSPEKNSRKIRVIGRRNVTPQVDEQNSATTENEI